MKKLSLWISGLVCLGLVILVVFKSGGESERRRMGEAVVKTNSTKSGDDLETASSSATRAEFLSKSSQVLRDDSEFKELRTAATLRKKELLALIESDPRRALDAAFTMEEWLALPEEVRELVETPFSQVSSVEVIPFCEGPNGERENFHGSEILVDGQQAVMPESEVFRMSKSRLPVRGFELDGVMVVDSQVYERLNSENSDQVLAEFPVSERGLGVDPTSGRPADPNVRALIGGVVHSFENEGSLLTLAAAIEEAAGMPGPDTLTAALDRLKGDKPVSSDEIFESARKSFSDWTETPKSVLFLRVEFSREDGTLLPTPFSESELRSLLEAASASIEEMSYGKTHLNVTVTPEVLTLPGTAEDYAGQDYRLLYRDAAFLAGGEGYDSDAFDIVGVSHPSNYSSWSGRASIGGGIQWLNGSVSTGVIVHEFGHNYGLQHASFWDTSDGSVMGAGSHVEYGNCFDMMGDAYSYPSGEFSAFSRTLLSWVPAENTQEVTAETGTYRLHRFDHPDADQNGLLSLQVQNGDSETFWLDYRGRFPSYRGLGILWDYDNTERGRLLDLTPDSGATSSADKDDSALAVGAVFLDPTNSVQITALAQGGTAPNDWIDVRVEYGTFDNQPPEVAIDSSPQTVQATANGEFLGYRN